MNWFLLTVGYSGISKKAPGTVGSFVSLILGVLIITFFDTTTLFLGALLATVAGYKLVNDYEAAGGIHDNKHIVIDELAGMWISLSIAVAIPFSHMSMDPTSPFTQLPAEVYSNFSQHWILWLSIVLSFVSFRYFDIAKPSIIGRIDKNTKGGLGVMGDDVVAGAVAGVLTALIIEALYYFLEAA